MILESGIEIDNIAMVDTSENEALGVDIFHLPESDYIRFTKDLYGKCICCSRCHRRTSRTCPNVPLPYGKLSKLQQGRTKHHDDIQRVSMT